MPETFGATHGQSHETWSYVPRGLPGNGGLATKRSREGADAHLGIARDALDLLGSHAGSVIGPGRTIARPRGDHLDADGPSGPAESLVIGQDGRRVEPQRCF